MYNNGPCIFNVFKPARITSYDVVRHFKKNLPSGFGKIGHFGTLDPFASGVLLIGVKGAAKFNDYIHQYCLKTYLAVGKLGVETPTGDLTVEPTQKDHTRYLKEEISSFSTHFIEKQLQNRFLGDYWQEPHKYSAAKFEGKALHQWAREGIEIKKPAVKRHIYSIDVVRYEFPYLSLRVKVSSGTYVRTLFSDCAQHLGTIGSLVSLVREAVGHANSSQAIHKKSWPQMKSWDVDQYALRPDQLMPFDQIILNSKLAKLFFNGVQLGVHQYEARQQGLFWVYHEKGRLLGLAESTDKLVAKVNLVGDYSEPL